MPDIHSRIALLEQKFLPSDILVPGTDLYRCILDNGRLGWKLELGPMCSQKFSFEGHSIEDVLAQAERYEVC